MARMMKEILRGFIFLEDIPESATGPFPSPNDFLNKIFIKGSKSETFKMPDEEIDRHKFLCFVWTIPNDGQKSRKRKFRKQMSIIRNDFDSDDDDIEGINKRSNIP